MIASPMIFPFYDYVTFLFLWLRHLKLLFFYDYVSYNFLFMITSLIIFSFYDYVTYNFFFLWLRHL